MLSVFVLSRNESDYLCNRVIVNLGYNAVEMKSQLTQDKTYCHVIYIHDLLLFILCTVEIKLLNFADLYHIRNNLYVNARYN